MSSSVSVASRIAVDDDDDVDDVDVVVDVDVDVDWSFAIDDGVVESLIADMIADIAGVSTRDDVLESPAVVVDGVGTATPLDDDDDDDDGADLRTRLLTDEPPLLDVVDAVVVDGCVGVLGAVDVDEDVASTIATLLDDDDASGDFIDDDFAPTGESINVALLSDDSARLGTTIDVDVALDVELDAERVDDTGWLM